MAKRTNQGRSQDRKRVAGAQDYEVRYEAKKTGKSKAAVKRAAKSAGPSRQKGRATARKIAIGRWIAEQSIGHMRSHDSPIS
jgi:Protein of unknown function (DUF3606)